MTQYTCKVYCKCSVIISQDCPPNRSVAVTLSQSRLHTARRLVAASVVFVETSISPQGCSISSCNSQEYFLSRTNAMHIATEMDCVALMQFIS